MTTVHLLPHAEALAVGTDPPRGTAAPLLYHQWRTVEALRDHPVVINCCDTGTGKTEAALRGLLLPTLRSQGALLVAPTNELIHQHAETAARFVVRHGLPHRVLPIHAEVVDALRVQRPTRQERKGETLERVLNDPAALKPAGGGPTLVVTNPDIFYYALFYAGYGPHDRRNLFTTFVSRFGYIIVDEVHYYTPKQLVLFLFYFALWREWGYFARGQRACLLSATPDSLLETYLGRLFPEPDGVAWVRPGEVPAEDAGQVVTLAPTTVEIVASEVDSWAAGAGREHLADWLREGQDGAVISGALWRINVAHAALAADPRFQGRLARLTGAETRAARTAAPQAQLVLATPTVDIGFNFEKPGKERQPLDFVVADARRADEAIQRLGRAGRVLGRIHTDCPARGVLLVPEEACTALGELDGQTMERSAFRRAVHGALPARSGLEAYMRSYAVLEVFRPIFEVQRQMLTGSEGYLDQLIDRVWQVFAPGSRRWGNGYAYGLWRRHARMAEVVHRGRVDGADAFAEDYLNWLGEGGTEAPQLEGVAAALRRDPQAVRALVVPWVEAEYAKWDALFHFRDAFDGPAAGVADAGHLLSGADTVVYDLLHVVANFEAEWFPTREALLSGVGFDPGGECAAYARLLRQRPAAERLRLRFAYTAPDRMTPRFWTPLYTRRPVALRGLRLLASGRDGDVPLPPAVHHAIHEQYVPLLLVPECDAGAFRLQLRQQGVSGRTLDVEFPAEERQERFWAVAGTAAYTVHAALRGYFGVKERREATAPFIV